RVKSIHQVAATIQKLVPTARIAVAHGQMAGKELEDIMVSFVNRETDVLICTTIIESGLDIPTANTIIINRADQLGLAEIYQLRGRVGRSSLQSYAYLLVPSLDTLTKDSRDRLRALMDCNELGGGFKLAMSDLQIRGGGNLLGVSQSGHIAAIGYDLYLDLLQRTVADLKASALHGGQDKSVAEDIDTEINLQISAYIPEQYMPDISQRYVTYRRIAALATSAAAMQDELRDELVDRYGPLPPETVNLLQIVSIKRDLAALRISKLEKGKDSLVYSFMEDTPLSPEMLLRSLQTPARKRPAQAAKLTPDGRLVVPCRAATIEELFRAITQTITELRNMCNAAA
ncbi:MAG: transcription-repair coupling factor, partial [Desulfobulbaceae bacterium]